MPAGTTPTASLVSPRQGSGSYTTPMALMVTLYFGIGFITALNDILVPHFKDLFHLSNVLALMVQFAFFGAYFVMSVPSGWVVGRLGAKGSIVLALSVMGLGLLLFFPASVLILYPVFLFALFVVGSGLALLQVAINPYVGALGRPETAASRLNLCGAFNSVATTAAPFVGAAFIFIAAGATRQQLARSVRAPYMVLAGLAFLLALLTRFVPLPRLLESDAGAEAGTGGSAWEFRNLRFGAAAIFTYVGAEVAIGSLMINFLGQPAMGGLSHTAAARYVSLYWGGAMTGRLIGFVALIWISAPVALTAVSAVAAVLVATAIVAHGNVALFAIVACGLCNSVMWPCIFPMALRGLGRFTSQGSGILVTMVVGGAVIPEIQGFLADRFGYSQSFLIVLACYVYILFFALNGHRPGRQRVLSQDVREPGLAGGL